MAWCLRNSLGMNAIPSYNSMMYYSLLSNIYNLFLFTKLNVCLNYCLQESHHHSAFDQILNADRQSMLAELRDLRAHATIARMHQQEERDRYTEKIANTEDNALKKERQLKRQGRVVYFGTKFKTVTILTDSF